MTAKKIATIFGIILIILGVLGFIGGMGIVGEDGVFVTNTSHDLIHLVAGVILLVVGLKSPAASGMWLKILGIVFLLISLLGFFMGDVILGFANANMAGHVLHIVLAIIFLWVGFKSAKSEMPMGAGGMA